ncbi:L-rhamnose-binding lectin ELEL-1 [Halyomorpha halys]|uniref:L-rhamnose-binding lectin ELEL-1 n=1 Tax=Halyomorpha halys TaxID=286706 RepID=UPI0006D51077|nr:L-rhamnose-binding lectin ELEL-1-like [Halyomorpha halys]
MKQQLVAFVAVLFAQASIVLGGECPVCAPPQLIEVKEVTVCEREQTTLICPRGSTVQIHDAFYGRANPKTCRHPSATEENQTCSAPEALQIISKRCTGQRECDLAAANFWFVDPCKGINKYLDVSYSCTKSDFSMYY